MKSYREYVTPEAWAELRRFVAASRQKATDGAFQGARTKADILNDVLVKMDELVAPVPRAVLAQQPRVEFGVNLGGVFISENVLGDLQDRGTQYSVDSGDTPVLLDRNVGEALAKYGLAAQETRGGWHATELLKSFMNKYEEERSKTRG